MTSHIMTINHIITILLKELDDRVEDMIANMNNKHYNFWISEFKNLV